MTLRRRKTGLIVVVSGPSGVGKSTLCRAMLSDLEGLTLSVSCTTRKPRPGERDGVDYYFLDEAQFRDMIARDEFIEWAQVYDHLYGTPWKAVIQAHEAETDVLLDIDAQGARQIMARVKEAVFVFVTPPSLEALRTRLVARASDPPEEIERRLQHASEEIANFHTYHYLVRNEDLVQATKELEAIIIAERLKTSRLDKRWLVEQGLLVKTTVSCPSRSGL
ncbi:MAG: guanylate kinase [Nitrospirae bacterium]|nr:MAG: guanylate kinase [Nitrospirota bacterium]